MTAAGNAQNPDGRPSTSRSRLTNAVNEDTQFPMKKLLRLIIARSRCGCGDMLSPFSPTLATVTPMLASLDLRVANMKSLSLATNTATADTFFTAFLMCLIIVCSDGRHSSPDRNPFSFLFSKIMHNTTF